VSTIVHVSRQSKGPQRHSHNARHLLYFVSQANFESVIESVYKVHFAKISRAPVCPSSAALRSQCNA
jgi:hypothetical protein